MVCTPDILGRAMLTVILLGLAENPRSFYSKIPATVHLMSTWLPSWAVTPSTQQNLRMQRFTETSALLWTVLWLLFFVFNAEWNFDLHQTKHCAIAVSSNIPGSRTRFPSSECLLPHHSTHSQGHQQFACSVPQYIYILRPQKPNCAMCFDN